MVSHVLAQVLEAHHHRLRLARVVPISRWTVLSGAVLGLASLLAWRPLARRLGWRPGPTLLALLGLAGTLALTLAPRDWLANHRSLDRCLPPDVSAVTDAAFRVGGSLESLLNVSMLMPLGLGLVLASRRVVWPAVLVVVLPAAIELTQVIVPGRQCSVEDWLANSLGGLIAVGVGAVLDRAWRRVERDATGRAGGPTESRGPVRRI